jgi:late competence protein required for DNA uptake (superfamily II DNA/RNA helicase)
MLIKSAGLGITTLLLYCIAWNCTTNNDWSGGRVCTLTSPRIDHTIDLVTRLKAVRHAVSKWMNWIQF